MTTTSPVELNWVQAQELHHLLTGLSGWFIEGNPAAHDDLARHLAATAARDGGPLAGAGSDTLGLFESFIDVYAMILEPETHP